MFVSESLVVAAMAVHAVVAAAAAVRFAVDAASAVVGFCATQLLATHSHDSTNWVVATVGVSVRDYSPVGEVAVALVAAVTVVVVVVRKQHYQ